jgi:hypothetical protein
MFIVSNPFFTAGIGFLLGLLTWVIQQQYGDRRQKHRVLTLLYRENAQNLKTLYDFWSQVTNNLKDYRQNDLQKYYRLAYSHLPPWNRLMWESQASSLPLIEGKLIGEMYNLIQNLDTFIVLRQKIRDVFEIEENKKLWCDYQAWMKAYYNGDPIERNEAQNGENGLAMDKKVNQLSTSLIPLWNELNILYTHIHDLGNPIPAQEKSGN